MSVVNKIFVDKMGGRTVDEFIGVQGDLFYDTTGSDLRISDGVTSGGTSLLTPTTSMPYRGFYASFGSFYGNDPSVNQIIISRNQNMRVAYATSGTNDDDMYADGLAGSDLVVVLNLYGSRSDKGIDAAKVERFVKAFIDVVLGGSEYSNDMYDIKSQFYSEIDNVIAQFLPPDSLFTNFAFSDSNQDSMDSWNRLVEISPGDVPGGAPAILSIFADQNSEGYPYQNNGRNTDGQGFTVDQVIVVPGTEFGLVSPDNDMTITITDVNEVGSIVNYTVSGSGLGFQWPENYIQDGGDDQYDDANFLNTNFATEISYAQGMVQEQSPAVIGDYVVCYKSSVFMFAFNGAEVSKFYFSGNMGADGYGDKVEKSLFGYETAQNSETIDDFNNLIVADNSDQTVNIPGGETHPIPNFSGMVMINDHYSGAVELWICGGGNVMGVSSTNESFSTMQEAPDVGGYSWTNSNNLTGPFTFTVVKTRAEA